MVTNDEDFQIFGGSALAAVGSGTAAVAATVADLEADWSLTDPKCTHTDTYKHTPISRRCWQFFSKEEELAPL